MIRFLSFDLIMGYSLEIARKVWSDLHVSENIIRSLLEQKFFDPTPIQRLTLPAAIRDRLDIIGAAETVIPSFSHSLSFNLLCSGQWQNLSLCYSNSNSYESIVRR